MVYIFILQKNVAQQGRIHPFFIGPGSNHSLRISETHWLTDDLVEDLMNWPIHAHYTDYADYVDYVDYAEYAEYAEYVKYAEYAEYVKYA